MGHPRIDTAAWTPSRTPSSSAFIQIAIKPIVGRIAAEGTLPIIRSLLSLGLSLLRIESIPTLIPIASAIGMRWVRAIRVIGRMRSSLLALCLNLLILLLLILILAFSLILALSLLRRIATALLLLLSMLAVLLLIRR